MVSLALRFLSQLSCARPIVTQQPLKIWVCYNRQMATEQTTSLADVKPMIGVVQLTCTSDKEQNFQTCRDLILRAKLKGAQVVFLPEAVDYIAETTQKSMAMSEEMDGQTMSKYCQLAKDQDVWLSVGGFHQQGPSEDGRILNTHVVIDNTGAILSSYCKAHLFDVTGKVSLSESKYTCPGNRIVSPVSTPVGKVALGICYDLRFPEMWLAMRQLGAEILTFPSAFTVPTGLAHWEVLLRARAIENQCYVVAAAQTGKHNDKRSSYGHTMVVDPWGTVVAQCREGSDVCVAEIDLPYLQKVRQDMPLWDQRRYDLYGQIQISMKEEIDCQTEYRFGQISIQSRFVFYRSALSYCFVNIKPVLPGHVLVAPIRCAEKLADLNPAEIADLFTAVQQVSTEIQNHFDGTSVTISIQDGPDAGQTIRHLHVHILPRKPGDFVNNDDIYKELETHDKDTRQGRSESSMEKEAAQLRQYFI